MRIQLKLAITLLLATLSHESHADSIYLIGNSVTDTVNYDGFAALAVSRSKVQPWGRQMIPGAPLEWLWDHPADGFTNTPYGYPSNALPNYAWDVLSLQPFDRSLTSDLDYTQRYLGLLYGAASPTASQSTNRLATRLFIFGRWPRQDDATRVGGPRDFDTLWLRTYSTNDNNSQESADYASDLTLAVRGVSVAGVSMQSRTFMVPVGHVMYALNQQMKAGQIAGYTNIFQIYADGVHLNNIGSYLTACTCFAVMYRESPVGLPVPSQYGNISPTLATQIQETVWNVVQTETLSGVPSAGNLLLTSPAVPPAYSGKPYSTTLLAVGGIAPRTYSVTSGALPPGLALSSAGVLSGTPNTPGSFEFTVTASDATTPTHLTVSRTYNLIVDVNTAPVITTTEILPGVACGERYDQTLAVTGGNGVRSWSLTSGALPPGIQLGAGGVLVGSALVAGSYNFTLSVSDSDSPPDVASRAFSLTVAPPAAETLLVPRTTSPIRVDGAFTETHWNLANSATHNLLGTPDNNMVFATLWDADNLYLAARVEDCRLSFGSGSGAERDAIEFFIDAFNDKQTEFNSQHRQFRIALDSALFERGGRANGVKHALVWTPGGYQLEMSIPWTNLGITPVADQTVIGLDLANDDADSTSARQHYQTFAFADPTDPRPSQFGNAILTSATVSGTGGEPHGITGPSPIAHEPFDYAAAQLHNTGGAPSFGFLGNWQVESATSPGFAVEGQDSLSYGQLGTSGRYMTGGHAYQTTGRSLDVSGVFSAWKRSSDGYIGKLGTSLWISYLACPLKSGSAMKFSLDDSGAVFHDNNGRLRVRQTDGVWELSLMNETVKAPTSTAVVANTTCLMVLRIDFGSTHTANLYVNPALGATSPAVASATATTTDTNFRFNELEFYPGSSAGDGRFDELRIGASWESVVPIPSPPVAPVTFSPLPGESPTPPTATFGTTTAGATIYYTTNGTIPTVSSTQYSGPITLQSAATIRAIAVKSGATSSVPSGATYTVKSPYDQWSGTQSWPLPVETNRQPNADPDGDRMSNLLEYAFGTSPTVPSPTPWSAKISNLKYEISYPRLRANLSYRVETSADLSTWTEAGVTQDTTTPVGQLATASIPFLSQAGANRFVRMKISLP